MTYKSTEKTRAYYREYMREWKKKNGEKIKGYAKKRYPKIKEKKAKYNKEWREKNREHVVEYYTEKNKTDKAKDGKYQSKIKKNFGLSLDEYNKMFEAQNGRCKICDRHQSEFNYRLGVDHNHTTGQIRGLLCKSCNSVIGYINDDSNIAKKMAEYLDEYNITS